MLYFSIVLIIKTDTALLYSNKPSLVFIESGVLRSKIKLQLQLNPAGLLSIATKIYFVKEMYNVFKPNASTEKRPKSVKCIFNMKMTFSLEFTYI